MNPGQPGERAVSAVPTRHPGFGLKTAVIRGRPVAVSERILLKRPFCRLIHFRRTACESDPAVLVVAPLSGHFATLLRDMLVALLPEHDLYLMDWIDAREVSPAQGDFGLEANIGYIIDCIEKLGSDVHPIALCQSAMPALAAAALLADEGKHQLPSLTLIGGMIDTRINPTRIDHLARFQPLSWFERYAVGTVPSSYPGQGRAVYPADIHRLALIAYLVRHLASGAELLRKLQHDDGADCERYPFLRLYLSLMDLPARFFLDTIRFVFQEFAFPRGRLCWQGHPVNPAALSRTALMTIEGELDDISGRGQTQVAHEICRNIPDHRRRHHVEARAGHFGLFHGHAWRTDILPRIRAFVREMR